MISGSMSNLAEGEGESSAYQGVLDAIGAAVGVQVVAGAGESKK